MIRVKRIYDPVEPSDGHRVLVDRLWPRGVAKATAALDEWLKAVAPSAELRVWFDHRADRWEEFQLRYRLELAAPAAAAELARLAALSRAGPLTLLTASREMTMNLAVVLKAILDNAPGSEG